MANNPSSSPAAAKRKRVGAALVSPFRKLSSRLRPVRGSATPPSNTPVASGPQPEKPADPPAA
ncbi:MAG: hypothetical protein ACKOTE_12120 [Opitutaceae bacterium]